MSRLQRIDKKRRDQIDTYEGTEEQYEIDYNYEYNEGTESDKTYSESENIDAENYEYEEEEEIELTEEDEEELRYYAKVYVDESPEECEEEIMNIKSVCDETSNGLKNLEKFIGFMVLIELIFLFSFHGQIPEAKNYIYVVVPISIVSMLTLVYFLDGYIKEKLKDALYGDGSIDALLATYIVEEYESRYGEVFDDYRYYAT